MGRGLEHAAVGHMINSPIEYLYINLIGVKFETARIYEMIKRRLICAKFGRGPTYGKVFNL